MFLLLIGFFYVFLLIYILIICIASFVSNWFIFKKAGQAPWKALIPYYNQWVLCEFSMGHGAYMFLPFIPVVGVVAAFYMNWQTCRAFNKGVGFYLGYIFLYPVFTFILAFDKSEYVGPQKNLWDK